MKINQVLVESAGATVAFAFGRFNPAHQGHIEVWRTVEQAGKNWFVGTNPETSGVNDPLPYDVKSAWMEEIYPPISGHIIPKTNVLELAAYIFKKLRNNERATVAYITDAEDWAWSGKLLNQYNGVEGSHGYYKFAQIIHEPSPRVSSATALRTAARADDKVAFYHASGTDPKLKVNGLTYFDTVKQYMQPHIEKELAKAQAAEQRAQAKAEKERLKAEKAAAKASKVKTIKPAKESVAEDEQKTVAKTWDQMTPKEKISGVKGRTVWNEKTRKYYTVFDVPAKQETDEASLSTMRDFFAGDKEARDPYEITKQRLYFDPKAVANKRKDFRSQAEYEQWLKKHNLKQISGVKEDDESAEIEKTGQLIPWPAGTAKIHVSDVYDWYKLGQVISDLDDADPNTFGQGAPQTVIAFGSEEEESKLLPLLKRLGLKVDDIDPAGTEIDEACHAGALYEYLKKVHGKWALVSKSNPNKVLQYYRGGDEKPSDEWVSKVERRVHSFESKKK